MCFQERIFQGKIFTLVLSIILFIDLSLISRNAWSAELIAIYAFQYVITVLNSKVSLKEMFICRFLKFLTCRPALQLPGASKPVVAVRFCPIAFSLRGSNPGTLLMVNL